MSKEAPTEQDRWPALRYIAKSGLDAALSWLWSLAGLGLLIFASALWLFVWSDESKWFFQWIKYAVAFGLGALFMIGLIGMLVGIDLRQKKTNLKARYLAFVSTEKGYLDHKADLDPSNSRLG
jgi:hypothetical protein